MGTFISGVRCERLIEILKIIVDQDVKYAEKGLHILCQKDMDKLKEFIAYFELGNEIDQ